MNRPVVVAANSIWNIVNFRAGLVRALRDAGYEPVVVAPFDRACADRIAELDVTTVDVAIERAGLNPLADAALVQAYRRVLARVRPVAFLGFTIKPNIYGCLAARSLGIPALANVSGLGTAFAKRGPLRRLVLLLYRFALARARRVFFQNSDDRSEFLEERVIKREQAGLLPGSGVDLQRFSPEPLPPGPPVFLLVARLLADKGIREFVSAARVLRLEFPDARFQLLGPIDEVNPSAISGSELDQWVSDGTIEYLGSRDDVREAIAGASAVVLPSYYREGVPRSLLEGAAMARPLISTDMPGCRELVVNQPGGLACKPRDDDSLMAAMRMIARMSPDQRSAMGSEARRLVENGFGEERVISAYLDELAALVPTG